MLFATFWNCMRDEFFAFSASRSKNCNMPVYNICLQRKTLSANAPHSLFVGSPLVNPLRSDCDSKAFAIIHNKCGERNCLKVDQAGLVQERIVCHRNIATMCEIKEGKADWQEVNNAPAATEKKTSDIFVDKFADFPLASRIDFAKIAPTAATSLLKVQSTASAIRWNNAILRIQHRNEWIDQSWKSVTAVSPSLWLPFAEYYPCAHDLDQVSIAPTEETHRTLSKDVVSFVCGLSLLSKKSECAAVVFISTSEKLNSDAQILANLHQEVALLRKVPHCTVHAFLCTASTKDLLRVPKFASTGKHAKILLHKWCAAEAGSTSQATFSALFSQTDSLQHIDVMRLNLRGYEYAFVRSFFGNRIQVPSVGQVLIDWFSTEESNSAGGHAVILQSRRLLEHVRLLEARLLFLALQQPSSTWELESRRHTLWLNASIL